MSFGALLQSELPWLTLLALALASVLIYARRYERAVYQNTLWLFLMGIVGQGVAVAVFALDFPVAAQALRNVFHFVAAIALIRLFGFAVFRLLLPLAGRTPPRIAEDLTIIGAYVV